MSRHGGDDWGGQFGFQTTGYIRSLASLDGYTPAMRPVRPVLMSGKGNASVSIKNSFDASGEHSAGPMDVPIFDLVVESRRNMRNKTNHKKKFLSDGCNCAGSCSPAAASSSSSTAVMSMITTLRSTAMASYDIQTLAAYPMGAVGSGACTKSRAEPTCGD